MKSQKNKNHVWIAWAIVALLVVVRFWYLGSNPPALNWDEASHGVNAKSLLSSGRDEWGVYFPDIFRAFGDYKLPVYVYLTSIVVGVMGLSEFSVRFVSAVAGLVTCWFVYLILKKQFKNPVLPFLGVLVSLTLPWHVFLSRIALEANLSLAFVVAGFYGVFYKDQKRFQNLGLVAFALSIHTYNSARVVVPFLIVAAVTRHLRNRTVRSIIPGLFVVCAGFLLMGYQVYKGTGLSRYEKLNLLSDSNVYMIGQMRVNSQLPPLAARIIYNRPTYLGYRIVSNYRNYFSLGFLTQVNGPQAQFAIPGQNLILWANTIMAVAGAIYLTVTDRKKAVTVFLLLLGAFLPATLTDSPPQALRPLYAIPLTVALITYGYAALMNLSEKRRSVIVGAAITLTLLEFGGFAWKYARVYPKTYSHVWQYGYKQMTAKVVNRSADFDRVIVTKYYGEPHIFLAFWGAYPVTSLVPSEDNIRFGQSGWFWTDKIGKYYFVNDWDINQDNDTVKTESGLSLPLHRSLLVTREENMFANSKVLDRVYDLEGDVVFVISSYE